MIVLYIYCFFFFCVTAFQLEYFHVEDMFLTGFCAERCGFPRIKHPGFSSGRMEVHEVNDDQILIHYMDDERKRAMSERLSPLNSQTAVEEKKNSSCHCFCH